jgi:hypothetical protein
MLPTQALCEERAAAIERLQLQLELANEKAALLTAEITQLEQESRHVRLLRARVCGWVCMRVRVRCSLGQLSMQPVHTRARCRAALDAPQAHAQLQQQLAAATSKLAEFTAADGLIDRAITAAADEGACQHMPALAASAVLGCLLAAQHKRQARLHAHADA